MNVHAIYVGSDGEATRELYAALEALGPRGVVALNLFRAQKCSERAKAYRGRGYRGEAYARKQWSLENLCRALQECGMRNAECGIAGWGWKEDPGQEYHRWVLYVELPTGQVSFHTDQRGAGPDYAGMWDGRREVCAGRIVSWVARLLAPVQASAGERPIANCPLEIANCKLEGAQAVRPAPPALL